MPASPSATAIALPMPESAPVTIAVDGANVDWTGDVGMALSTVVGVDVAAAAVPSTAWPEPSTGKEAG